MSLIMESMVPFLTSLQMMSWSDGNGQFHRPSEVTQPLALSIHAGVFLFKKPLASLRYELGKGSIKVC